MFLIFPICPSVVVAVVAFFLLDSCPSMLFACPSGAALSCKFPVFARTFFIAVVVFLSVENALALLLMYVLVPLIGPSITNFGACGFSASAAPSSIVPLCSLLVMKLTLYSKWTHLVFWIPSLFCIINDKICPLYCKEHFWINGELFNLYTIPL
ncbi:hypothetical protein RJT34_07917 [Clitoria ternatea]|uniref:Uncharacterized protein n=1 Tax=Clitoria ternatea TaxID=43366 RepID=A0AAN9PU90_CLITE